MKFSINWLKRHLITDLNIHQLAEKLTSIGLEVESVENPEDIFKRFRIVQIQSAEKHPDADRLKVCKVIDGSGNILQIVCGAPNARTGLKTILATPGALIPATNTVLKKSAIRGVQSEGMMCSYHELSIPSADNGIIELDDSVDLQSSVGDALNYEGGIIDISVTPNRGDCLSVRGIARDLAAAGVGKLIDVEKKTIDGSYSFPISVNYKKNEASVQYAPMMAFRLIKNVQNITSPDWLKNDLKVAGINSISLIVDLANWVMLDIGKPLHIYDADKIEENFTIRLANNKEQFIDIKGNEHELQQDMLVSSDKKGVLCLLGVMGGQRCACTQDTKNILIESAIFDPVFISKTGTFLNIMSDSRSRFERGIDSESCISSIQMITKLIQENCGGEPSEIYVIGNSPNNNVLVPITKQKLKNISGCDFDWEIVKTTLSKLGLTEIKSTDNESLYSIPSWRNDLNIEEDLIEEVLRITGYDNIHEQNLDNITTPIDPVFEKRNILTNVLKLLASNGLSEIVTYSFIKDVYAVAFKEDKKLIHLINPISTDMNVMRPSIIPSLLLSAVRSINYGDSMVRICESGKIFYDDCIEKTCIAGLRAGLAFSRNWMQKSRFVDAFDAKKDMLIALSAFGINEDDIVIERKIPSYYHPGRSGSVFYRKKLLGYFGEIHPKINKLFGISDRVVCFEIFTDNCAIKDKKISYTDKVFPKICRDFAFIFDEKVAVGNIMNAICKLDNRISKTDIFDSYDIGESKKSIGISVVLDAIDRTLTDDEANEVSNKIVNYINNVGGELRTK